MLPRARKVKGRNRTFYSTNDLKKKIGVFRVDSKNIRLNS